MYKLTKNAVKCLACDTVLESKHRHDYKECNCDNQTMTDGGYDYQRWGGKDFNKIQNLAEYEFVLNILGRGTENFNKYFNNNLHLPDMFGTNKINKCFSIVTKDNIVPLHQNWMSKKQIVVEDFNNIIDDDIYNIIVELDWYCNYYDVFILHCDSTSITQAINNVIKIIHEKILTTDDIKDTLSKRFYLIYEEFLLNRKQAISE